MNHKKLGAIILIISLAVSFLLVQMMGGLTTEAQNQGCFKDEGCGQIQSSLTVVHFGFGLIGFIIGLGFYLIFFSKSEEAILQRLEENKEDNLKEERFHLILKGLDSFEKRVMKAIKDQMGITQNTLKIRTDMSKAKLSYVVNDLEKKGLIKRVKKGKTFAVFFKEFI